MPRVAVLLRGINVGSSKRVAMADLRAALEEDGLGGTRTILQTGNVVVDAGRRAAPAVARRVGDVASRVAGGDVGALGITAAVLRAALDDNPLWDEGRDGARMVTAFSSARGTPVEEPRRGAERLGGGTAHIAADRGGVGLAHQWCPDGVSTAPPLEDLVAFPDGTVVTVRNRNTIRKILAALEDG